MIFYILSTYILNLFWVDLFAIVLKYLLIIYNGYLDLSDILVFVKMDNDMLKSTKCAKLIYTYIDNKYKIKTHCTLL